MLTDNFVKFRNVLHIPVDEYTCICGNSHSGEILELAIVDTNKYKQCKICFDGYTANKGKPHDKPAKADKRRTSLATW